MIYSAKEKNGRKDVIVSANNVPIKVTPLRLCDFSTMTVFLVFIYFPIFSLSAARFSFQLLEEIRGKAHILAQRRESGEGIKVFLLTFSVFENLHVILFPRRRDSFFCIDLCFSFSTSSFSRYSSFTCGFVLQRALHNPVPLRLFGEKLHHKLNSFLISATFRSWMKKRRKSRVRDLIL